MEIDIHDRLRDLCQGITLRLVPSNVLRRLSDEHLHWHFGAMTRALIAADPAVLEFSAFDEYREPTCPICGESANPPAEAMRASLDLYFGKTNIGKSVWAHGKCLSVCVDTGEQRGFPY